MMCWQALESHVHVDRFRTDMVCCDAYDSRLSCSCLISLQLCWHEPHCHHPFGSLSRMNETVDRMICPSMSIGCSVQEAPFEWSIDELIITN